ncbi:MAG: hypothetical protein RL330_1344 [Actinomycetota bacterium]|jgi:peptidylprolyl isomerase
MLGTTALGACGGSNDTADAEAAVEEPKVALPANLPTELGVTDLTVGTGREAVAGDMVLVYYVGVRSEDGERFDGNYGSRPFPVRIGAGGVIAGWDQGLLGVREGGVRQLDIPADLAYGDEPRGDVIRAGDALSFVITVDLVIPASTLADEPKVTVEGGPNVADVVLTDLVTGDGTAAEVGGAAVFHLVAYRGDTGERIDSSWDDGEPYFMEIIDGETFPGFVSSIPGMKPGGRRQVRVPFMSAFGPDGSPDLGLPASTDLILVLDLLAIYL